MQEMYIEYLDEYGDIGIKKYVVETEEEAIKIFKWGHPDCKIRDIEKWKYMGEK